MVRMVREAVPREGTVVMGKVLYISGNRATVHLLEYDCKAEMALDSPYEDAKGLSFRRHPLPAVGRLEALAVVGIEVEEHLCNPVLRRRRGVRSGVLRSLQILRLTVSRDLDVQAIHLAEGLFAVRSHVRTILSSAAIRTRYTLSALYLLLDWPQSVEELQQAVARLAAVVPPVQVAVPLVQAGANVFQVIHQCILETSYFSYRMVRPDLLSPTIPVPNGLCWTAALLRQMEALLKSENLLPLHKFLSSQDLINGTGRDYLIGRSRAISDLEGARHPLIRGIVTDDVCPLNGQRSPTPPGGHRTYRISEMEVMDDQDPGYKSIWEQFLSTSVFEQGLAGGGGPRIPVAASVVWWPSYKFWDGTGIVRPTQTEITSYNLNPRKENYEYHTMLLSGKGTQGGVRYLEFQDTTSEDTVGDRGYLKFACDPCPVVEFVMMKI